MGLMTVNYETGRENLEKLVEWYKGKEGQRN
jgi:hypothetical protein